MGQYSCVRVGLDDEENAKHRGQGRAEEGRNKVRRSIRKEDGGLVSSFWPIWAHMVLCGGVVGGTTWDGPRG